MNRSTTDAFSRIREIVINVVFFQDFLHIGIAKFLSHIRLQIFFTLSNNLSDSVSRIVKRVLTHYVLMRRGDWDTMSHKNSNSKQYIKT